MDPSRVVIIGAGFGGLWAAKALTHSPVDVWLVDRKNYHTFSPLLYQVAAAELEPEDIIYPLRSVFHGHPNIHIMLGEIVGIDFSRKEILTRQHHIGYDYLIFSLGSQAYYYGVEGAGEHAFPLKDIEDAVRLRNHILCMFESSSSISDEKLRKRMLTFSIVGGGPTGIEFCGALVELVRKPLKRDYPNLDMDQVRIILLEATDHLLRGLPERLHKYALNRLTKMGVEVHLNLPVHQITSTGIVLKDGNIIPTQTVVWTAGVQGNKLSHRLNLPTQPNGQVDVLPTLQATGHPEIYVVGDMAHMEQGGKDLLMIAPVATQEGVWAAKNVLRQIEGSQPKPFHYKDPGMMAVTGRNAAAVRLGAATFTGFPAWIIWALVHLYRLIGFRNRLLVFINWAMDYIFFERVVRLITPMPPSESSPEGCLE
jgi:NADH:ubiquinone reductase (H+-translocating)